LHLPCFLISGHLLLYALRMITFLAPNLSWFKDPVIECPSRAPRFGCSSLRRCSSFLLSASLAQKLDHSNFITLPPPLIPELKWFKTPPCDPQSPTQPSSPFQVPFLTMLILAKTFVFHHEIRVQCLTRLLRPREGFTHITLPALMPDSDNVS